MKHIIVFLSGILISLASMAQNAVIQPGNPPAPETVSSPDTIYILMIAIGVTAFLFLIVYALGRANRTLADNLRDHLER